MGPSSIVTRWLYLYIIREVPSTINPWYKFVFVIVNILLEHGPYMEKVQFLFSQNKILEMQIYDRNSLTIKLNQTWIYGIVTINHLPTYFLVFKIFLQQIKSIM